MKLDKLLTINGQVFPLVYDEVHLNLNTPGRASFTIETDQAITGLVTFDIGYNKKLHRLFNGYVESCTQSNLNEYRLFCREQSAVLKEKLLLNLRHCTLRSLINEIAKKTGLAFTLPSADYTKQKAAFFYNIGTGYNAMDAIKEVFNIDDYVWQQEDSGAIYVGSWANSYWAEINPIEIPLKFFKDYQPTGLASVATIPVLRPGARLSNGGRIQSIITIGEEMTIKWKK